MKYKKFMALAIVFISYVIFVNCFGNYKLVQTITYSQASRNSKGLTITPTASHSLSVEVIRARQFFGLLPTYIYFPAPKLYLYKGDLYYIPPKWREVRIKTLNNLFLASTLFTLFLFILIELKPLNTKEK